LVFHRTVLLEVVHPLSICQYTEFDGLMLANENFASTQKFKRPSSWNDWSYRIKYYGVNDLPAEFKKSL